VNISRHDYSGRGKCDSLRSPGDRKKNNLLKMATKHTGITLPVCFARHVLFFLEKQTLESGNNKS